MRGVAVSGVAVSGVAVRGVEKLKTRLAHLGDEAGRLECREEGGEPARQDAPRGEEDDQPKGLGEHQHVERDDAEGKAPARESRVLGAALPKGGLQVGECAEVDNDVLATEEQGGRRAPDRVARLEEVGAHEHVGRHVLRKNEAQKVSKGFGVLHKTLARRTT